LAEGGAVRAYTAGAWPLDAMRKQVRALVNAVSAPHGGEAAIQASAHALFRKLFPGDAGKRVLAARRLLISPDGPLWELPFAALVTNPAGPPKYLGAER